MPIFFSLVGEDASVTSQVSKATTMDLCPEAPNLESEVAEGLQILDSLRNILTKYSANQTCSALKSIDEAKAKADRTKVIIGVVGSTGAGKSSVINAILDEERLVPTNAVRACTSVVTEISYNYESTRYKADIEFISSEDWEKELRILLQDIQDGDVSEGCSNENSGFAVSCAKVEAVYSMSKTDIMSSSIQELMMHENVSGLLGTTVTFSEEKPARFCQKLKTYVDSGKKRRNANECLKTPAGSNATALGRGGQANIRMEFWPLIRIVRLYVKAPVLSTGAVIVDLPGMQDSNAARASVANNYVEKCSAIWIVAPIIRAVSDHIAIKLLGDSFKRQMQMDGRFGDITFICSKTDDIIPDDVQDSLEIDEMLEPLWKRVAEADVRILSLEEEIKELENVAQQIYDKLDDLDESSIEIRDSQKGEYSSQKRKQDTDDLSSQPTKRQFTISDKGCGGGSDIGPTNLLEWPVEETVNQNIRDPVTERTELRVQKREIKSKLQLARARLHNAREGKLEAEYDISRLCVTERNGYAKRRIKNDFATGIRELDQMDAGELDEYTIDPDVDERDYNKIADSLSVFCVSSIEYQKLKGRFRKDLKGKVFKHLEDTEIPELQRHCLNLTVGERKATSERFLNSLSQLLNSFMLRSLCNGPGEILCKEQRDDRIEFLENRLNKLHSDLEKLVADVSGQLTHTIKVRVFNKFALASSRAKRSANDTVSRWNSGEGSQYVHWNTYRAICRHDGVFQSIRGLHDWNEQLTGPMIKAISPGWEKSFSHCIPKALTLFATQCGNTIDSFHKDIETYTSSMMTSYSELFRTLASQLNTYHSSFEYLATSAQKTINSKQREANREFTPSIAKALHFTYYDCAQGRGRGMFRQMKDILSRDVEKARHHIFDTSAEGVKSLLKEMISSVQGALTDDVNKVFTNIARDYRAIAERSQNAEERALNAEIMALLTPILSKNSHSRSQAGGDQIGSLEILRAMLTGHKIDESHEDMKLG